MDALKFYLDYIKKFEPLSKAQERETILKAKAGDKKAYELIINSNLRFVVSVAKKYQNRGIALDDLIAEGNKGLVKAYYKFDVERNVKFITYGVWWIRQNIMNCIHDNAKLIRLPWNKIVSISKIHKLAEEIEKEYGRHVDIGELEEIYKDREDIMRLFQDYKYKYTVVALDKPQTPNAKNLNDVIPSNYENKIEEQQLQDEISMLLNDFTPREREIVRMYHGIGYVRSYTLKEIGIDLGLTRERIRQIKEKVFETLRKKKKLGKLKGLFND